MIPSAERFPSIAQIRAVCDAVAELIKWADRNGPPWTDTDLEIARRRIQAIDREFRGIARERKTMRPIPLGARGWNIEVDRMLEKIQHTTGRLHSRWQISRPLPLVNISGGIGDYPEPVLERADRTVLVNARDTLAEEADKAEREAKSDGPTKRARSKRVKKEDPTLKPFPCSQREVWKAMTGYSTRPPGSYLKRLAGQKILRYEEVKPVTWGDSGSPSGRNAGGNRKPNKGSNHNYEVRWINDDVHRAMTRKIEEMRHPGMVVAKES
jgi:hypothetical protein